MAITTPHSQVKLNDEGLIDPILLNQIKSSDVCFTALRNLVNSPALINVIQIASFNAHNWERTETSKQTFDRAKIFRGATLVGRSSTKEGKYAYSHDNDVWVYINPYLNNREAAVTFAHEAYGHAWRYIMGFSPWAHMYESTWNDEEGILEISYKDTELERRISEVENQAEENFQGGN